MGTFKEHLEALWRGEKPRSPLAELLGFELIEHEAGGAFFSMQVTQQHWNMMGTVYGGVITTIAEAAMGVAFATTLAEGESFTVIELRSNFLRPIRKGRIDARARLVERGRTIGLVECELRNENNKLIAKASSTCMVLRGEAKTTD